MNKISIINHLNKLRFSRRGCTGRGPVGDERGEVNPRSVAFFGLALGHQGERLGGQHRAEPEAGHGEVGLARVHAGVLGGLVAP